MRILVPHDSEGFHGGGSTFVRNFKKATNKFGHEVVTEGDYDILLISGATLVDKETVRKAEADGKKIVLRVDNILEDRKNRNSGMSRLKEYAKVADVIVYQSEWARRMFIPLIGDGVVMPNGVDTSIYHPSENKTDYGVTRIFYSKHSRNETKQFHEVQYWWREYNLERQDDTLVLVGRFADDYLRIDHPFDFHNFETVEFHGQVTDEHHMADIMRSCDVAFLPYMFDACSNTILEAQACGLPVIYSPTGGTPEIVKYGVPVNYMDKPSDMVRFALGKKKEFHPTDFEVTFGLEKMGERYDALFRTIGITIHEV